MTARSLKSIALGNTISFNVLLYKLLKLSICITMLLPEINRDDHIYIHLTGEFKPLYDSILSDIRCISLRRLISSPKSRINDFTTVHK